jgi:hypothetical protein
MLKTNIDKIAKQSSAMIIIAILKGYIKHPVVFFKYLGVVELTMQYLILIYHKKLLFTVME